MPETLTQSRTPPATVTQASSESGASNGNDNGNGKTGADSHQGDLEASIQKKSRWPFRLRPDDDDEEQDWWFASTAIPLLAATTGPMANLLSIAALVTSWRNQYGPLHKDAQFTRIPDPHWCIAANTASLVCGFVGNLFLLLNFTQRVRYIIALPMTIIMWYSATIILICITATMNNTIPPVPGLQTYSQGFWHAVLAACIYMLSSMLLMVNMMGYFLGHYPQHFTLNEHQRTLILQTMMFFIWLGGGGAIFARVDGWSFVDALYFCDVTILTVGFGDFYPVNDTGRGLIFPFSVGGIIVLGLMVGSIRRFAMELSADKVLKHHVEKKRTLTVGRAVTTSAEYGERQQNLDIARSGDISRPFDLRNRTIAFADSQPQRTDSEGETPGLGLTRRLTNTVVKQPRNIIRRTVSRTPKVILLREEKDRFDAMREIQHNTNRFKRWYNLTLSICAFGLLWCVGAAVFMVAEKEEQGLSYFQALYFCYVSLLTIGYGDLSPKSNLGKPFFIVWSLIAVPTMTILVSDMGDTVIAAFKQGTFHLADLTVLPQAGKWRKVLEKYPWLLLWIQKKIDERAAAKRIRRGFQDPSDDDALETIPTIEELAEGAPQDSDLARKLTAAIRRTADDLHAYPPKRYSYEEWVEFTRLIRFSSNSAAEVEEVEEEEGIVKWDWIGEDSPMLADGTESEWVLDRLCESLDRHMRRQAKHVEAHAETIKGQQEMIMSQSESGPDNAPEYSKEK